MDYISQKYGGICHKSISRVWQAYREASEAGNDPPDFSYHRVGHSGRKSKLTPEVRGHYVDIAQEYASLYIRLNGRVLKKELSQLGVHLSLSSVQRHLRVLKSRKLNLRLKPKLTGVQKQNRVKFVLKQMDRSHGLNRATHRYKSQLDTVHVDESWFFMHTISNQVVVFDGVNIPEAPSTWHKSHIIKVMFLVAMARPQVLPDGTVFDGKIGLWPCITQTPAKKSSKNRPKGTMETKTRNVSASYYRELFTMPGGVLAKIKEKMPGVHGRRVFIQQDGATPHTGESNATHIAQHGSQGGWNFKIITQPSQSPDLNILDLGFFHSLKTRVTQIKFRANTLPDLIGKVIQAYEEYDAATLDHIWGHLFRVYNSVLQNHGANDYKAPHQGGRRAHKEGPTSVNLTIDLAAYNAAADDYE